VRALACQGLEVWLEYEEWRVKCPTTGKATKESISGVLLTRRFTEALADEIGRYADRTSVLEASRRHNIDYKTALAFEKAYLVRKQAHAPLVNPTRIGVDELLLGKMGWRIVVSDLDACRPIWIGGKDRTQESFAGFFTWLGEEKCKKIRLGVMDMWKPYLKALKKACPTADVVFDKFHVVAQLSKAMDEVRRSEYSRLNGEKRKFIKGQRFNLLANRGNLSRTGRQELQETFKANRRLLTAYLLKEDFDRLWSYKSETWMLKFWNAWKEGLKWKRLEPFQKVARMVESHWEGIASWCKMENRVPLGFVEGMNGRIRKIQSRGYGYKDVDHLDLKILTCMLPEAPSMTIDLEELFRPTKRTARINQS
jgi:transposase